MSKEIAVKVENISKKFIQHNGQDFWALNNVSFEVHKGEVLGIIGGNGAGKSTLLQMLSGITTPDKGKITIEGKTASILGVGAGFHPELSGKENIYLNGALLGMSKKEIESVFNDIVAFSELENFINEPVKHYSNGMYLRLAFSIYAHLDADIILIDEVLNVGDAHFSKKSIAKINELISIGKTFIVVSHEINEIKNMASRLVLLDKGKVLCDANADEVLEQYLLSQLQTDIVHSNVIDKTRHSDYFHDSPYCTIRSISVFNASG